MTPEVWAELLRWFIGVSGGGTVVVLVAKALGKQLLSRDIERHKAELSHNSQAEIAKLQASLAKKQVEHQEQVRWLQPKRGDAIERMQEAYVAGLTALEAAGSVVELSVELGHPPGAFYGPTVTAANDAIQRFQTALVAVGTVLPKALVVPLAEAGREFSGMLSSLRWLEMATAPELTPETSEKDVEAMTAKILEFRSLIDKRTASVMGAIRKAIDPED